MPTEYHWEHVKSIKATDEKGNSYQIEEEQWVATLLPLDGRTHSARGKIRFTCNGEPVNLIQGSKYKLVRNGIILTPDPQSEI